MGENTEIKIVNDAERLQQLRAEKDEMLSREKQLNAEIEQEYQPEELENV